MESSAARCTRKISVAETQNVPTWESVYNFWTDSIFVPVPYFLNCLFFISFSKIYPTRDAPVIPTFFYIWYTARYRIQLAGYRILKIAGYPVSGHIGYRYPAGYSVSGFWISRISGQISILCIPMPNKCILNPVDIGTSRTAGKSFFFTYD
jgi:hypothetical protein